MLGVLVVLKYFRLSHFKQLRAVSNSYIILAKYVVCIVDYHLQRIIIELYDPVNLLTFPALVTLSSSVVRTRNTVTFTVE